MTSAPPVAPADGGRRAFVVLALLGTGLRLALTWAGWCDNHVVADDAFYYFQIARHVALGHGATFDGLAPTNGFHPLWLLMLVPVFALTHALHAGAWVPVHAALSLAALLDLATGALLFALLRRLGCPRGAGLAAAVWFLSPFTVLLSLRGMESALDVTLVALWLWVALGAFARGLPGPRDGARLGLVSGLAFLARTDNGPLLAVALLVMTGAALGRARGGWARAAGFVGAAGAVAALLALPWFAWNLATFGTPFQVSGAVKLANPAVFGHVAPGTANALRYLGAFVWTPGYFLAGESMRFRAAFQVIAGGLVGLVLALVPFLAVALWRLRATAAPVLVLGLLAYVAAHGVVYALVIRTYVIWYATVPFFLAVLALAGLGGEVLAALLGPAVRAALAALALAAGAVTLAWFFHASEVQPRGEELALRGIFAKVRALAPGARTVGVFNAGAAGYFAPGFGPFTVVNLDGLVNNAAVEAWRRGRYLEYLERDVDVVIDDADATLNFLLGPGRRARFDERFPRWSPGSLLHGPKLQAPVR